MKNKTKYNFIARAALVALVLTVTLAFSANAASPYASSHGSGFNPVGIAAPASTLWYNGDLDGRNGLANETNTFGAGVQAGVYDDFNVTGPGWNLSAVFSDNLANTTINGVSWEIRQGVSEMNPGTLIASGSTTTNFTVTPTGRNAFGFLEYQVEVTGINVTLAPGNYFLNVTPNGSIDGGRSFQSTTSGANCIGTPCGNNYNSWFNSTTFGTVFDATGNQLGAGTWDFSGGVVGTVVPEPATVALVTCGLGALLIAVRRRRS